MGTQPFDYAAIIADLEAKKAALEQTISSFRAALALGALGQAADGSGTASPSLAGSSITGSEVPAGAFLGRSIPEAAKLYLEIVKKKQTSREIAEALQKGGMESTSKNFIGIVHAVLDRARKAPNASLVKIGSQWGLAGWYPKGLVSAAATNGQGKSAKKKRGKKAKANSAPAARPENPFPALPAGKATDRALEFIRSKPDAEYSLADVAKHLGMNTSGTRLMLGKLVKAGKIRMSAPGSYTAAPFGQAAATAN